MGILLASTILLAIGAAIEIQRDPDNVDSLRMSAGKLCEWAGAILSELY
jgi:hypothetical protein